MSKTIMESVDKLEIGKEYLFSDGGSSWEKGVLVDKDNKRDYYRFQSNTGSKSEWFKFIKGVETKPVYTQDMAYKGELPIVGMECTLLTSAIDKSTNGYIEYQNEIGFLFRYSENNLCDFYENSEDIHFKPLTQVIELEHGKAYQFVTIEDNTIHGIYSEDEHSFTGTSVEWSVDSCTCIEPLTVD